MYVLKTIVNWGWSPVLITALAVIGYIYEWPVEVLVTVLIVILLIGLVVAIIRARASDLERSSSRLRQLAGYFNQRFMGNSSLSIFAIIDSLFKIDNPKLWDWAKNCDTVKRIFDTWCGSFISRVESDISTRRFDILLRNYLNELWLLTTHYYEFVEQFYEVAKQIEIPHDIIDQYNKFAVEYNNFAQDFRDSISDLRKFARTEIEPPSVKFAAELSIVK